MSLDESKIFEGFRIGRLEVEVCGDVAAEFELVRVRVVVQQLLQPPQLFVLPRREVVLVRGTTFEGQRVVRVLRVLLVKDIVLAVVPVWERRCVGASLLDGPGWFGDLLDFARGALAFLPLELRLVRRR